ncbi:MAG: radical SAM protein [candidate division Zixibacteria bacterium]|nr:radical SAM protein [candidate division Zixibacteria bacterium]
MKVTASAGKEGIATVYIAQTEDGKTVEFIESVQPPIPIEKKWVIIVSTLFGCPIKCTICDAGNFYQGKLTKDQIFAQIDYPIKRRFPDFDIPVEKFKVQFARMGEPTFNPNVLDVLDELPSRYKAPGLIPCISTIAPSGVDNFFERLIEIKNKLYPGRFQLQFSIHTSDEKLRDRLIPTRKWDFARIAQYGEKFHKSGDRKITLNFALADNLPMNHAVLSLYFDPEIFLVKITPINPTYRASESGLKSFINPKTIIDERVLKYQLKKLGYEVIVSIGELEENKIGSNCGQYVTRHLKEAKSLEDGYSYKLQKLH